MPENVALSQEGSDASARLRDLADEYEALAVKEAAEKVIGWEQRARLLRQIAVELLKRA